MTTTIHLGGAIHLTWLATYYHTVSDSNSKKIAAVMPVLDQPFASPLRGLLGKGVLTSARAFVRERITQLGCASAGWAARIRAARAALLEPRDQALADSAQDPLQEAPGTITALLDEFDAISEAGRERSAVALVSLWGAFQQTFGGIDQFMAASAEETAAYLERLRGTERRLEQARGGDSACYYYAVSLMAHYLSCWRDRQSGPEARRLGATVAALIDRGGRSTLALAA